MCFVNAVLQLLVHSPQFWNLIKDMSRQSEAGGPAETGGGGGIPLVDATVIFCEEFMFKEKGPPPMQQPLQQATMVKPGENEEEKKENKESFEPTYMYDAIKEKMQLKNLMVRFRASFP
jgi:hypothetical protein